MQFVLTLPGRGVGLVTEDTELYPRYALEQIGTVGLVLKELIGAQALKMMELCVVVHTVVGRMQAEIRYTMGVVEVRVPLTGAGTKNAKRSHLRALTASALNVAIVSAKVDIDRAAAAASAAESAASADASAAQATRAEVAACRAEAAAAKATQAAGQAQELFRRLQPLERYHALLDGTYSRDVVEGALAAAAAAASTALAAAATSTAAAAPPAVCVICMEPHAVLLSMCPGGHSHGTPHTLCLECVRGVLTANNDGDVEDLDEDSPEWSRTGVHCPMCKADADAPAGCVREVDHFGEKRRILSDLYVYTAAGERRAFSDVVSEEEVIADARSAFQARIGAPGGPPDAAPGSEAATTQAGGAGGAGPGPPEPSAANTPEPSEATVEAPPWACARCTYVHKGREASYLACAMCGKLQSAPPPPPPTPPPDASSHAVATIATATATAPSVAAGAVAPPPPPPPLQQQQQQQQQQQHVQPPPRRVRQRSSAWDTYQHTPGDVVCAVRQMYGEFVANLSPTTIMGIYESRAQLESHGAFADIIESMEPWLLMHLGS